MKFINISLYKLKFGESRYMSKNDKGLKKLIIAHKNVPINLICGAMALKNDAFESSDLLMCGGKKDQNKAIISAQVHAEIRW